PRRPSTCTAFCAAAGSRPDGSCGATPGTRAATIPCRPLRPPRPSDRTALMDNQRVFIWAALALVLWLNYLAWQRDYPPEPVSAAPGVSAPASQAPEDTLPDLPSSSGAPAAPRSAEGAARAEPQAATIRVVTDVLDMDISTRGGDLIRADLLDYPVAKNRP